MPSRHVTFLLLLYMEGLEEEGNDYGLLDILVMGGGKRRSSRRRLALPGRLEVDYGQEK